MGQEKSTRSEELIRLTERFSARNYAPLPVVITRAQGVWAWDLEGRKYLDCLSAYSSLNQGHRHPRVMQALIAQAECLTLTSRAQVGVSGEGGRPRSGRDRRLPQ